MSISLKTHKLLWGASGNACAKCKSLLVEDATATDDASHPGEEAHIVSNRPNGPRFSDPLPIDRRDFVENLILLCNKCHKIVDDQVATYPADDLRKMKKEQEDSIRASITPDNSAKLRDDLVYSEYIQHWESTAELDHWDCWSSYMLSADAPCMRRDLKDAFVSLNEYLLSRVWPHRYPTLENAFARFRGILNDLLGEFRRHSVHCKSDTGIIATEKFYKTGGWLEQDEFHWRVNQYEFYTDTLRDLTLELTRAANLICDLVRTYISPAYRLEQGRLLVSMGPFSDMSVRTFVAEYQGDQRTAEYSGLANFLAERENRDYAAGRGTEATKGYGNESCGD